MRMRGVATSRRTAGQSGVSTTEYVVAVALIAVVVMAALSWLGKLDKSAFCQVSGGLQQGVGCSVTGWGSDKYGQLGNGSYTWPADTPYYGPTTANGLSVVMSSMSVGYYHVMALSTEGSIWGWGEDTSGELGNGTTGTFTQPVQATAFASSLSGAGEKAKAVYAGNQYSLVLANDGTVWAAGIDTECDIGNGATCGSGTVTTPYHLTTASFGNNPVTSLDAGYSTVLAVTSSGAVYGWGNNQQCEVDSTCAGSSCFPGAYCVQSPELIAGLPSNMVGVGGNVYDSMAITSDGHVYGWGANGQGELCLGATGSRAHATLTNLSNVTSLATHGDIFTIALKRDGTVVSCGDNSTYELGNGSTQNLLDGSIQNVSGLSGITAVEANIYGGVALKTDGTVWAWGQDTQGQLGDAGGANSDVPVKIPGVTHAVAVGSGYYFNGDLNAGVSASA